MKNLTLIIALILVVVIVHTALAEDNSTNSTQANDCITNGYKCYDMSCGAGFQLMPELKCPSLEEGNRPEVCCKEVVDLSKEPKIILNKDIYQEGDFFQATFQLPYNADCNDYFISPSGQELQHSGGGCGIYPSFSMNDITARLKELFGSAQLGTYQVKFITNKSGYDPITLTKDFQLVKAPSSYKSSCTVQNGAGICQFLEKSYDITHKGCGVGSSLDLTFNYDGKTDTFTNSEESSELTLKNGIKVKIDGSPCSVYQVSLKFKKFGDMNITEEGNFFVMKNSIISLNDVEATIQEISWGLSGNTDTIVSINGNNAQVCYLKVGEECKIFYGAVNHPISKNLIIHVNSIYKNDAQPDESAASITVTKINEMLQRIEPINQIDSVEVPQENNPKDPIYSCNGCTLNSKCYPFGYRKDNQYCNEDYNFINQLSGDKSCENSFQCSSNVCVNNKCISSSLLNRIFSWFKRLGHD